MAESSQPQRQLDNRPLAAVDVLRGLELLVVEQRKNEFRVIGDPPGWLRELMPDAAADSAIDLVSQFPLIEIFLPEAEDLWSSSVSGSAVSDLWTETLPDGSPLRLQARALPVLGRRVLLIYRAELEHRSQQLLQQYAHEIELLNHEVERANQAKSAFLANMSHEIRTPMNAILGMAELLGESQLTDEQRRYVETFQRAGRSLLSLINDILDLSKVESGKLTLENAAFDLEDVIGRAVELIRIKANEKGLSVTSQVDGAVPRYLVGDATRLRQILINLLGNSLKFTEKGGLTVNVELTAESADTVALRFAISDTGIGIPADKLDKIFESFAQADDSTTAKYGGTGLGLSISKKFVELMHGHIWVESVVGEGSTFNFTACFGIAEKPVITAASTERPTVHPCRILLADDSEDNRFLIRAYLKDSPCTLEVAENGEIALQKLQNDEYDMVLMDLHMPVMDGFTATTKFREFERSNHRDPLPLLALTADAFQGSLDKTIAAGFTAYLTKPIRKATLLEAIANHARHREASNEVTVRVDPAIADIVPIFLRNIQPNAEKILKALDAGDMDAPRTLGHNMKGTGTAYGFPFITELGTDIERAAKEGNCDTIRSKALELASYLERLKIEYP